MKKNEIVQLLKGIKLVISALLLIPCMSSIAVAQGSLSAHLGPAFPMGAFADDADFDVHGAAGIGLGVGAQYVHSLSDNGLGLFGGLDIIFNGLNNDIKNMFKDENPGSSFTFEKYINIPISAGVHYLYGVNDGVDIYGKVGLTASFLKMTKFLWEEPGDDDFIETYNLSVTAGFLFGAGVILNDQIEVGLSVMGLGKHTVMADLEYGSDTDTFEFERKVALFNLTFGYMLQ